MRPNKAAPGPEPSPGPGPPCCSVGVEDSRSAGGNRVFMVPTWTFPNLHLSDSATICLLSQPPNLYSHRLVSLCPSSSLSLSLSHSSFFSLTLFPLYSVTFGPPLSLSRSLSFPFSLVKSASPCESDKTPFESSHILSMY